jgi:uncharacterized protein
MTRHRPESVPDPIVRETAATIRRVLGSELQTITVERAVIGVFFTGVKLDNGIAGACATPIKTIPEAVCCPSSAMAMPFPGRLHGRRALDLLDETEAASGLRRAVGIATLNAVADLCWQRRPHPEFEVREGVDAFDATAIRPGDRVVVVGAFIPFLRALKARGIEYLVLENDPGTLKSEELPFFRQADQAPQILPAADVVLATGTTLLNHTLDTLLGHIRPDAQVTLVGPTVPLLPDAFEQRGVNVLGGIRVTHADEFLDILCEGGSGYHFFGKSAERVVVVRRVTALPGEAHARGISTALV